MNPTSMKIPGLHHVTAICGAPGPNLAFYTGLLGLRLVKLTVNYDDPGTYHLYYGDGQGSPGTILTFFSWPGAAPGRLGAGMTRSTALAAPENSLPFWRDRLTAAGHAVTPFERFGEPGLAFLDPDGLMIELLATAESDPARAWTGAGLPAAAALRGLHSVTLGEAALEPTADLLSGPMGLWLVGREDGRARYAAGEGRAAEIVDLVTAPEPARGRVSSGAVHHVAWRTPTDESEREIHEELAAGGYTVSAILDRTYFHSIYWREPGGVLFEVATDQPGFAVDEPAATLGGRLILPAWLEPMREALVRDLPPLALPEAVGA